MLRRCTAPTRAGDDNSLSASGARLFCEVMSLSAEIPATVSADDVLSWSDDVDVVVIGFGIAGGCAAVSAAAAGARVLVLERAAVAGGTTSLAGGHFYLGGGTAVQQATGNPDSPEEMYKYLVAVSQQP